MDIFLNVMHAISESRFWLMPLLLGCVCVVLAEELIGVVKDGIASSRGSQ